MRLLFAKCLHLPLPYRPLDPKTHQTEFPSPSIKRKISSIRGRKKIKRWIMMSERSSSLERPDLSSKVSIEPICKGCRNEYTSCNSRSPPALSIKC